MLRCFSKASANCVNASRTFAGAACSFRRQQSSFQHAGSLELDDARKRLSSLGGKGAVTLDLTRFPYVAVLTIDNTQKANAISCKMMLELERAIHDLREWKDGRAVILQGAGQTFCAGADLSGGDVFFEKDSGAAMNAVMSHATTQLSQLPLLSVAAIEGAAVGGGAELATACDFRIMADTASIQFVHVTRGVTPGWGGITRLVELCGRKSALYLLASGMKVSPELAAVEHLVDAIVQPTEAMPIAEHALEFLRPLIHLENSHVSSADIHDMKTAVSQVARLHDFKEKQHFEAKTFVNRWGGSSQMSFLSQWKKK